MNRSQDQVLAGQSLSWRLQGGNALLTAGALSASLEVTHPARGLSALTWNGREVDGRLLGVMTDCSPLEAGNILPDTFVRGNDLVAYYSQNAQRAFSCQIYWRAALSVNGAVLVETIISVQTDQLESFPQIALETQLAIEQVWLVGGGRQGRGQPDPRQLVDSAGQTTSGDESACLVFRPADADWSYAEMTHPDDRGSWQIQRSVPGQPVVRRQLGGSFLEKGVIRLLRARGAFVPRENDLHLAAGCLAALAREAPPLTA